MTIDDDEDVRLDGEDADVHFDEQDDVRFDDEDLYFDDDEDDRETRPVSTRSIRWSIALVVVAALAAAGAAIYVVLDNRDPVPADVLACVRNADLPLNRSTASLNLARQDALTGRLVVTRALGLGADERRAAAGTGA